MKKCVSNSFCIIQSRNRISTCLKCPALPEMLKGALEKLPEEIPNYDTFCGPDSIALPHVSRNCLWIPYPLKKSSSIPSTEVSFVSI